jgi:hypothetical protein
VTREALAALLNVFEAAIRTMLLAQGTVLPMGMVVRAGGGVDPIWLKPDQPDVEALAMLRRLFEAAAADAAEAVVFLSQAWLGQGPEAIRWAAMGRSTATLPQRQEVVVLEGACAEGQEVRCYALRRGPAGPRLGRRRLPDNFKAGLLEALPWAPRP